MRRPSVRPARSAGYPAGRAEREALRVRSAEREYARGYRAGRSLRCEGYTGAERHAGEPGGCQNDGDGCLCPCHDRAEG